MSWRDDLRFWSSSRRKPVGFFGHLLRRPEMPPYEPAPGIPEPPDDSLVIVAIPPLSTMLLALRDQKGAALTEAEVLAHRDAAPSIAMKRADARAMAEARGFEDLDPENIWAEWQAFVAWYDAESLAAELRLNETDLCFV